MAAAPSRSSRQTRAFARCVSALRGIRIGHPGAQSIEDGSMHRAVGRLPVLSTTISIPHSFPEPQNRNQRQAPGGIIAHLTAHIDRDSLASSSPSGESRHGLIVSRDLHSARAALARTDQQRSTAALAQWQAAIASRFDPAPLCLRNRNARPSPSGGSEPPHQGRPHGQRLQAPPLLHSVRSRHGGWRPHPPGDRYPLSGQ